MMPSVQLCPLLRRGIIARKKSLCRASNGLFVRNIGWKKTTGGYAQHKFYLGREEQKAMLASLRLEQLWEQVSSWWEALDPVEKDTDRPVWDELTLTIAEAVRNGEAIARVPLPPDLRESPEDGVGVSLWLDDIRKSYPVVQIELASEKAAQSAAAADRQFAESMIETGRELLCVERGGETLHAALDAYTRWIGTKYLGVDKRVTAWGGTRTRQVAFIRSNLPDCPLGELNSQRVEEYIDVLRLRPNGQSGNPVSVSWTSNCIKQFRHFLRWLHKTPEFRWKRPIDLELTPVRIPLSAQEKSALVRSTQVQTYTIEELRRLWEYASPFQRLLILLALNCGFGRAEVASLELAEVLSHQKHPNEREVGYPSREEDGWIRRVRHKTGVYGEWKLWPETVAAVQWWLRQRAAIVLALGVTTLLVTRKGQRYDAPTKGNNANCRIPNSWLHLLDRIRKDHPDFRRLSYNKLRKTGGNLVRAEAGGEVAAVFLCHGSPVKSDDLLEAYTNRPFAKVFEAIDRVGERLRPLWACVSVPFPERRQRGGPTISPGKINRIQAMKRQGYKVGYIAEQVGVSTETVRRWAKRSAEPDVLPEAHPPRKVDGDTVT